MPTIPAPGSHGYTAREVLVLARVHHVHGRLISRSKNGLYETRAYAGHQARNPWVIIARPEQHHIDQWQDCADIASGANLPRITWDI